MTKAQLTALGIADDLAQKAADASAEELKSYIPKAKYDEAQQAVKTHMGTVAERDKQLEELKKSNNSEELTAKITQLQAENKAKDETHQKEMREVQINSALKLALTGKTHDFDLVAGLLDKTKIELADDGNVKSGLKEQIESLQKSKAFLFVPDKKETPIFKGVVPADGKDPTPPDAGQTAFPFNFQTVRPLPDTKN